MKQVVDVPEYDTGGISFYWDEGYMVESSVDGSALTIRGNAAALRSMARHLLTLAQGNVPPGTHIHLDEFGGLPRGSTELVLEKTE